MEINRLHSAFVVSAIVLIANSELAAAAEAKGSRDACASNAYIIESRDYFLGSDVRNRIAFDTMPSWVPEIGRTYISNATSLELDASDDEVALLLAGKSPKIKALGKLTQFNWTGRFDAGNYFFQVSKYAGCISQINVSFDGLRGNAPSHSIFLSQENVTPTGSSGFRDKNSDDCIYSRTVSQTFAHTIEGTPVKSSLEPIPRKAQEIFADFESYNFRRERLIEKYGEPKRNGDKRSWPALRSSEGVFDTTVVDQSGCEVRLSITWKDRRGLHHHLTRENRYNE